MVWERDQGICRCCGQDVTGLGARERTDLLANRRLAGIDFLRRWQHLWDADHIVEVVRGGGQCGLDGLQTLCRPCHKAKTGRLASERAAERRASQTANQLQLPT